MKKCKVKKWAISIGLYFLATSLSLGIAGMLWHWVGDTYWWLWLIVFSLLAIACWLVYTMICDYLDREWRN